MDFSKAGTGLVPPQVKAFLKWAEDDVEGFWEDAAIKSSNDIHWFKKWDKVFTWDYPTFKWFEGGLTNICYNCLDYNIERGRAGRAALIAESGETGEVHTVTYAQLLYKVQKAAAALRGMGVKKGDRVAVYMPPSIESLSVMLACARVGAIHVVIFAGFSAGAVADRVNISGAQYAIVQDQNLRRGKPVDLKKIVDEGLDKCPADQIKKVVVLKKGDNPPMKAGRDIFWDEFLAGGEGQSSAVEIMEANDPLFMLPTSGTTAKPKVTVQKHGGYQMYIYNMAKWIYGLKETDVWFCTSDIGWIVGHSYNTYGPLLHGCTSILYEGTPDFPRQDMWWDIVEKYKVTAMWLSPTGVRGLMRLGIEQPRKHDLSTVERIFCAGEVLNPPAWQWLQEEVFENRIPVMDHMWQTETSGPIFANPYGLGMIPIKPGSAGIPVPGIIAEIVDDRTGEKTPRGEKGAVLIKRPFPGLVSYLWGDREHEMYKGAYWEKTPATKGSYYCGDAATLDEDGYVWFAGRSDEVIKIAAHRIGTIEVENALIGHPAVAESGVSGVPDELRGEVASAFVVLRAGYEPTGALKKELITHVRNTMGPIVVIKDIQFVKMLPKTRSGKIMRRIMRTLWSNAELGDLSTIEEEASVAEIKEAIEKMRG
ncbi:MAG: acetate--CoA ligase [Eubacteriales bacterium]